MKKKSFLIPKLFLLALATICLSACIKNDNFIRGDAKVRIFNNVINDTSRNFFFNNVLLQTALTYNTNSAYLVVEGDKNYTIEARNNITSAASGSLVLQDSFKLGKNYSIYYTRKDTLPATVPNMVMFEDDVRQNVNEARVMFINLGYTLGSNVHFRSEDRKLDQTLKKGDKTDYISFTKVDSTARLYFNLVDSATVIDTISYTNFVRGRVYTILFDGTRRGKVKYRVVTN